MGGVAAVPDEGAEAEEVEVLEDWTSGGRWG